MVLLKCMSNLVLIEIKQKRNPTQKQMMVLMPLMLSAILS